MILSRPFSRQNRSHQSWTNASANQHTSILPKKPAPEQRAPSRPNFAPSSTGKSSTLSKIDLLKQRQKNGDNFTSPSASSINGQFVRRNVSSLGHYSTIHNSHFGPRADTPSSHIYAPASIASPSELAHSNKSRTSVNGFSHTQSNGCAHRQPPQHYAATSVNNAPVNKVHRPSVLQTSSDNGSSRGRSGRESALANLFGTIRRKATSRWSSSSGVSSENRQRSASSLSIRKGHGKHHQEPIYANGFLSSIPVEEKASKEANKPLEAEQIYAEGAHAIDSNAIPRSIEAELLHDLQQWTDGETRVFIEDEARLQPDFQQLNRTLINWINDELADQRIIIKDLREDLYDGQVLCKLIERLHRIKLDIVEVTQNEQAQKFKLYTVLNTFDKILSLQARWARVRWSVDGIHQKNLIEIIHLLVTLSKYYRAPIKLPPNVIVTASTYQKSPQTGQLTKRSHREQLTSGSVANTAEGALAVRLQEGRASSAAQQSQQQNQRDAFDALVEQAPEKLTVVTQALVKFCNRHLEKINLTAGHTLDAEQFSDGLLLVFLISSLEGYFVPLGQLFTTIERHKSKRAAPIYQETSLDTLPYIDANNNNSDKLPEANLHGDFKTFLEPTSFINTQPIEKLHNVNLALQLMEEAGLTQIRQQVRAEDLVNGSLKAVLRVLYALFSRYKHV